MIGSLQRPRGGDHGAGCGHAARQRADALGRYGRDCRRPIRILRDTVGFAHQVGPYPLEARAIAREKFLVVQAFADQCVDEREKHGGIGIGPDRDPSRSHCLRPIVADRAHVDDINACGRERPQRAGGRMGRAPALRHLRVLRIGAAEHHHQPAMPCDRGPRRQRTGNGLGRTQHVRQERKRGAEAVVGGLIDKTAGGTQKAMELAARGMENASRAPALRAAHDGSIAVLRLHPRNFRRDERERSIPRDRHEALAAAASAAAWTAPTFAHHRCRDTHRRMHARRYRVD